MKLNCESLNKVSNLNINLHDNLIKEFLISLKKHIKVRAHIILFINISMLFLLQDVQNINFRDTFKYLLDNILIRFVYKLYRQMK